MGELLSRDPVPSFPFEDAQPSRASHLALPPGLRTSTVHAGKARARDACGPWQVQQNRTQELVSKEALSRDGSSPLSLSVPVARSWPLPQEWPSCSDPGEAGSALCLCPAQDPDCGASGLVWKGPTWRPGTQCMSGGPCPMSQVGSHLSLPLDRALGLPPANHRISESRAQPCRPSPCQHRAQPGPRWCGMPGCSLAAAVIRHEACGGCGWQGVVGMPPGSQARPPRGGGHEGRPWPFWLEHCTGVCAPTLSAWHTGLSRHVCPKLSPVGWGRELHRPPSLWGA